MSAVGSSPTDAAVAQAMEHAVISQTQKRKWEDTMSMMVWTAAGFQHILYRLLNAQSNTPSDHVAIMSKAVPVAATDGANIIVNPDTFFEYSLPERVFITAHEIVHNILDDVNLLHRCNTSGKVPMNDHSSRPFDNETMQKAMDARINAMLVESRIGQMPKDAIFEKDVKGSDSVLDIYQGMYDKKFPKGGKNQPSNAPGPNPGGFDQVLAPGQANGQSPHKAAAARNPGQWAAEVAAAQTIETMKAQGKLGAALKRLFQSVLEPEVPWIDHIETLINRKVGDGGYDWTTPDPYMAVHDFFSPSPTGHGAGWIVVWGDTSGSRSDAELTSNMAELAGIMEAVNPERLTVVWCDADINHIDELQDPADLAVIQSRGTGGGGGTDFQPVLDWIDKNGEGAPDLFIGFTDGYVSFPKEPAFPTIWASSTDKSYPYGQVVRVNKVARNP